MPTSVTSTFFSLASALDIGFLLSGLPAVGIPLVMGDAEAQEDMFYLTYVLYISGYATNTARKVIVCVTMLMSIDRYLVVAFPMRMRRLEHLRCPRLYTLIVAVLAFLLDVNVLFRFKVVQAPASGERNTTVFTVARTNTA
nr:hypothetical protein BaRGS_019690 [Batillaria attramentaria]